MSAFAERDANEDVATEFEKERERARSVKLGSSRSFHLARFGLCGADCDAKGVASGCVAASELSRIRRALVDGTSGGHRSTTRINDSGKSSSRGAQSDRCRFARDGASLCVPPGCGASGCGHASGTREHFGVCRPAEGASGTRPAASTPYADASVARLGPHPMAREPQWSSC